MLQGLKNLYHLANAILANIFYGFPSRNLVVIGVTGTDGKTTTVNLVHHILMNCGYNCSMISTVGASLEGYIEDIGLHVTTPSSWTIQKLFKRIAKIPKTGKKYVVLEVTSHALDQYRIWGIDFEVAVLTNVTSEHMDYHKTYERYLNTKLKLLKKSKISVVNRDDKSYRAVKENLLDKKVLTYSAFAKAEITPFNLKIENSNLEKLNLHNALAAALACNALGVEIKDIEKALKTFVLPKGRQEIVFESGFRVMIDFAHTPNSFEKILSSINVEEGGRIIHVFGAAGKRDSAKRPVMGEISAKYSDIIILTAEDPRGEPVSKIMDDIEAGIIALEKNPQVFKISDRAEAIAAAVSMAQIGDFILITGKGHEKSMNINGKETPWSDEEAVKKAVGERLMIKD